MHKNLLLSDPNGHISRVLRDLVSYGWSIVNIPEQGRVSRNGVRLGLRTSEQEHSLRLFVYKVTTSGRSRAHERRIEITTTYNSGLRRLRGVRDVVLGVDLDSARYVGVDRRRLAMGGATHNASSFFDREGLAVKAGELLVNPRVVSSPLFQSGIEYHSFFDASRLSEYLLNQEEIHSGRYAFQGAFSGPLTKRNVPWPPGGAHAATGEAVVLSVSRQPRRSTARVSAKLIASVEEKDYKAAGRRITPAQLKELLSICDEVGSLGEQAVLANERKRLRRLGFHGQAARVERVSLQSVGEGYDIVSCEDDGKTKRYLEVKTTTGKGAVVDVSQTEWKAARRLGEQYYLVRVTTVKETPQLFYIRNPSQLEKDGSVVRSPAGWKVDLRAVMKAKA